MLVVRLSPNKAKLSTENAGKGVFTDDLMKVEDITNGYCTQFLINKYEGASAAKMRAFAESNGDSVVCIEDDDVINLHVHTAEPRQDPERGHQVRLPDQLQDREHARAVPRPPEAGQEP